MRIVLDSSVLIDHLRNLEEATNLIADATARGVELWSSYVVRTEVLAGMRPGEEARTYGLLNLVRWVDVDRTQSDAAGELGRRYGRSYPDIDTPDLLVATLAQQLAAELKTLNIKHFPMFPGLRPAY